MAGINLGLSRMERFMPAQPWKAIHVAGTNGKGSICAYLAAMLRSKRPGLRVGLLTSPHLLQPGDSIQVDGRPLSTERLAFIRDSLRLDPSVTSFEALTLVAFRHFLDSGVDVGVVEVGLGGRLDATNALRSKVVTVVSKIGLDHQKFLGGTVEAIALEKAGIMLPGVPCVVDGSNPPSVLDVLARHARETGCKLLSTADRPDALHALLASNPGGEGGGGLEPHQVENMACAILAYQAAVPDPEPAEDLVPVLMGVRIPGRLYDLDVSRKHPTRKAPILLDGAHNAQSAEVLGRYVDKRLRRPEEAVTWILCMSQAEGRNPGELLHSLLRKGDRLAAVEFGDVEGMPWVKPIEASRLRDVGVELGLRVEDMYDGPPTHEDAIPWAVAQAGNGPIVVAGSLYGVQAVLKAYSPDYFPADGG